MIRKSFVAAVGLCVVMGVSGCQGHKEDANSRFEALYTTEWKWRQEQFADDEDSHLVGLTAAHEAAPAEDELL